MSIITKEAKTLSVTSFSSIFFYLQTESSEIRLTRKTTEGDSKVERRFKNQS